MRMGLNLGFWSQDCKLGFADSRVAMAMTHASSATAMAATNLASRPTTSRSTSTPALAWGLRSATSIALIPSSMRNVAAVKGSMKKYTNSQRPLVRAAREASDGVRWWEKDGGPNFNDVHSTQEFVDALANAGDKLVVVEFYASWCGSCRALYPKLCKLAGEYENVEFLKVNFEENKPMCKSLGIKVLPYFHFYRGAEGRLEAFSCSLSKLQKLRDAIAQHNTDRCSIGPPVGVGNIFLTNQNDNAAAVATSSS